MYIKESTTTGLVIKGSVMHILLKAGGWYVTDFRMQGRQCILTMRMPEGWPDGKSV